MVEQIQIAALFAWLAMWVEHWFPWELWLHRPLPRVAAYTLGTLGMALPLTWLFWRWSVVVPAWRWAHLAALWVVIGAAGFSVALAYVLDHSAQWLSELRERVERMNGSARQD